MYEIFIIAIIIKNYPLSVFFRKTLNEKFKKFKKYS